MAPVERVRRALSEALPKPPVKAVKAVAEKRVVRLSQPPLEQWLVIGETGDHVVVPGVYCSCPAFTVNGVLRGKYAPCYHMVAVELAKASGSFVDLAGRLTASQLAEIVDEVFASGRSATLRRLLGW